MSKPLENKLIVITRSFDQSPVEMKLLSDNGAKVIPLPTIKIVPVEDYTEFYNQIRKIKRFDYIIFTSANAVNMFQDKLDEKELEIDYSRLKVVVVGRRTSAACYERNIPVDIIPQEFSASGVIEELDQFNIEGRNFFIPGSNISRDELTESLIDAGAGATFIPIYQTVKPDVEDIHSELGILKSNVPDIFIFTSPSSFKNYLELLEIKDPVKYFSAAEIAVIGKTTRREIEEAGLRAAFYPKEHTVEAIVHAIIARYEVED